MRFFATITVFASILSVVNAGNFLATCTDPRISIAGFYIDAKCSPAKNKRTPEFIWLEKCATVTDDGIIKCKKG